MDLTDAVQKSNYDKALAFMQRLRINAESAWTTNTGGIVEVVKGGKIPKAIYTVTRGPYRGYGSGGRRSSARFVDIEHVEAKVKFTEVPVRSLKTHPNFDLCLPYIWDSEYRQELQQLISNVLKSGCSEFAWKLFAEFVEEKECLPKWFSGYVDDANPEHYTPAWFAEAIRCLVSPEDPLFSAELVQPIKKPYYAR